MLFRAEELATANSDVIEHTDAEAGRIAQGRFPVRVRRGGAEEKVEEQTVGELPLFDMNGFMVVLRSWSPPVGTTGTADVIRSRFLWRTTVTYAGTEELQAAQRLLDAAGVPYASTVKVGRTADTIVATARDLGCDHIVFGDDAPGLAGRLFGSLAQQVRNLLGARADLQVIGS